MQATVSLKVPVLFPGAIDFPLDGARPRGRRAATEG